MMGSHAQAGFFYQNNIAALKVLEMLRRSGISYLTLDNPEHAEHIDDVVVHYADRVEYTQVKWAVGDKVRFTLYGIITPESEKKPSLLKQLADGYASIEEKTGSKIILCSTKQASTHTRPSDGLSHSLSDLIRDIINPCQLLAAGQSLNDLSSYATYAEILKQMKAATGLLNGDFEGFIRCLEFRLGQPPLERVQDQVRTELVELGIGREAYDSLLTGVVEWSISGEKVTLNIVEARLGILNRFVDGVAQVFPVENDQYVENEQLFADLDESIKQLPGGFILLEGPPGSGKSTALTVYKNRRDDIVVGYYCFIPDEVSFGNRRLEKLSFLKHLCNRIIQVFPSVVFPDWYSNDYVAKLDRWLHVLSETGKKVILLVDGLDHVYRGREHLDSPLTDALAGCVLPDNVYFLLSSQHLTALPLSVRRAIARDPLRHRKMPRLSESQVQEFTFKQGVHIDDQEIPLVAAKSEGNPLYLRYMCELLKINGIQGRRLLLDHLPALTAGNIISYHEMLYDDFSADSITISVLAVLAHRQEFTTRDTLLEILGNIGVMTDIANVELKLNGIRHMLKVRDGRCFAIFHNSFREFIREKTVYLLPKIDEGILAYYRSHPDADEAYRQRYRHLLSLQRYDEILADCSDVWLRRSWQALRPLNEIKINLDVAWQAALEKGDFIEFVRVALLLQEFGVIQRNLESSDCDMPNILLHCGHTPEAVRQIWNGERVQCSMPDFCRFAIEYRLRTGHILPSDIAHIAFDELSRPKSESELIQYLKARSLYVTWREIFAEIEGMSWSTKSEHEHRMEPVVDAERLLINERILTGVVDQLASIRANSQLGEIAREQTVSPIIRSKAAARLVSATLGSGYDTELEPICSLVDFTLLPLQERARLVILLEEHHRVCLAGSSCENLPPPEFFAPLTKSDMEFGLREDIFEIYDRLRVYLLQDDRAYHVCSLELDRYCAPVKSIFRALLELASLWCDTIRFSVKTEDKAQRLKKVFNLLNVPKSVKDASTRKNENDTYYISQSIHRLYVYPFEYLRDHIPVSDIPQIVRHWLDLDRGDGGYKNSRTNFLAAKILSDRYGTSLQDSVMQLLQHGEEQSRQDEETSILVSELLRCVEAYGHCGFTDHALRLWGEIFTCACGVHYRKDYQFNEAIDALVRAHSVSPTKTLARLAILLARAHRLADAARSKTRAIAIESLTELAAKISPQLGLTLISQEDEAIFRERAIRGLIQDAIATDSVPLDHLWAVTRTMNKWHNYTTYDEQTFPTMRDVFLCSLVRGETGLSREIYDFCLRLFMVEKGRSEHATEFVKLCREHGHDWPSEWRTAAETAVKNLEDQKGVATKREALDPFPKISCPTYAQLHATSERDFDEMVTLLDTVHRQCTEAERKRDSNNLYRRTGCDVCLRFSESVGQSGLGWTFNKARKGIRYFHRFQDAIAALDKDSESLHVQAIRQLVDRLIEDLALAVENTYWPDYVRAHVDLNALVIDLAKKTWRCDYWFHQKAITPHIQELLAKSSLPMLIRWEQFCKTHLSHHDLTEALFVMAKRQAASAPTVAIRLLEEAWYGNAEFFYLSGEERVHSFFDILFDLDANKAKGFLLRSFYESYHAKYSVELIYRLDYLTRYAAHFADVAAADDLYRLHERYNARLVEGLSESGRDYAWVAKFAPSMSPKQSVVSYLVDLFDYPEVEIRKLALDSLSWLINRDADALACAFDHAEKGSLNVKQHVVVLIHRCMLSNLNQVERFKDSLFRWTMIAHFNLRETIKELFLSAHERHAFLTCADLQRVVGINTSSPIIIPTILTPLPPRAKNFVPSSHLVSLLREAAIFSQSDDLADRLYERIVRKGWSAERGREAESVIHRGHNINTNFDTIEINGPYYQVVDEALNETVADEIGKDAIDEADVRHLCPLFRLYDPCSVTNTLIHRPCDVAWLADGTEENHFLTFADLPLSSEDMMTASDEWAWLYQDGHQRAMGDGIRGVTRTTYFRIVAFAVIPQLWEDSSVLLKRLKGKPYACFSNKYRTEMSNAFSPVTDFGLSGVTPLVDVSLNRFRGQNELSLAVPISGLVQELGLMQETATRLDFAFSGDRVVEFLEWMEPYDQGRRRQRPLSAGVGVRVKQGIFQKWMSTKGLRVAYYIEFHRSVDRYKSEPQMNWKVCEGIIAKDSATKVNDGQFTGNSLQTTYAPSDAFI